MKDSICVHTAYMMHGFVQDYARMAHHLCYAIAMGLHLKIFYHVQECIVAKPETCFRTEHCFTPFFAAEISSPCHILSLLPENPIYFISLIIILSTIKPLGLRLMQLYKSFSVTGSEL